jgi:D-sedoheptulose 7-phosphate isomerase
MDKKNIILEILNKSLEVKEISIKNNLDRIIQAADLISDAIKSGHKVMFFGNGGSAADAQHLAAEFVNRFKIERTPLAALALTTDTSIITSIGNDYHFDEIFSKQIMALGQKGDIAIGISTSGNSGNVLKAINVAKINGIFTIGFTGKGGKLAEISDLTLMVASDTTAQIQEIHISMGHIICDLVDRILFS